MAAEKEDTAQETCSSRLCWSRAVPLLHARRDDEHVSTSPIRILVLTRLSLGDRTLFVGQTGLERAKQLISSYKQGEIKVMTPELWKAKKVVDSTLHPGMERVDS